MAILYARAGPWDMRPPPLPLSHTRNYQQQYDRPAREARGACFDVRLSVCPPAWLWSIHLSVTIRQTCSPERHAGSGRTSVGVRRGLALSSIRRGRPGWPLRVPEMPNQNPETHTHRMQQ